MMHDTVGKTDTMEEIKMAFRYVYDTMYCFKMISSQNKILSSGMAGQMAMSWPMSMAG